jgi:hypothetical protein
MKMETKEQILWTVKELIKPLDRLLPQTRINELKCAARTVRALNMLIQDEREASILEAYVLIAHIKSHLSRLLLPETWEEFYELASWDSLLCLSALALAVRSPNEEFARMSEAILELDAGRRLVANIVLLEEGERSKWGPLAIPIPERLLRMKNDEYVGDRVNDLIYRMPKKSAA